MIVSKIMRVVKNDCGIVQMYSNKQMVVVMQFSGWQTTTENEWWAGEDEFQRVTESGIR